MGNFINRFFNRKKDIKILMLGLDAAGKTTILYRLKLGKVETITSAIGFSIETVQYKNVSFMVWDVGGEDQFRPLYRHYYKNTHGLIYVVDSNDRERLDQARDELYSALAEEELWDVPLLIMANKQDLPAALSVEKLTEKLGLNNLRRPWNIFPTLGNGHGLCEALDWLSSAVSQMDSEKAHVTSSNMDDEPIDGSDRSDSNAVIKSSNNYVYSAWTTFQEIFSIKTWWNKNNEPNKDLT